MLDLTKSGDIPGIYRPRPALQSAACEMSDCLRALLASEVRLPRGVFRVADLVAGIIQHRDDAADYQVHALRQIGMRLLFGQGGDAVLAIANNHPAITYLLAGTEWADEVPSGQGVYADRPSERRYAWLDALCEVTGAARSQSPVRFGSRKGQVACVQARAVLLPVGVVLAHIERLGPSE